MRICIFGAASSAINPEYIQKVEELGLKLALQGHSLVFGAGNNGLMGAAARGFREGKGYILGIVPSFFREDEIETLCPFCDELIETETMRERKQLMEDNSDAFVVVPGGIGTFEEFFEILTSKQLCRHNKPIAILNTRGYYEPMIAMLQQMVREKFLSKDCLDIIFVTEDLDQLCAYLVQPQSDRNVKDLKKG